MNCEDLRMYLSAYLDDELDIAESLRLEKHLTECRGCRELQDAQLDLRSALRDPGLRFQPSADFANRVATAVRQQAKQEARKESTWFDWLRGLALFGPSWLWAPAAAVLVVLIAAGAFLILHNARSSHEQLVASAVLTGHIRSLQAGHLVDVPSSDRHTVKPWFQGKLDFAPPVPDLSELDWHLIGGRLDYLDGRPVAAVVYQRRMHDINVFMWPHTGVPDGNIRQEEAQGYRILHWNGADMTYWVVSDLNRDELMQFARALRGR